MAVNGLFVACFLLWACGPLIKTAPFNERPDSIKPGSLIGPFEGQVVDADNQLPVAEAVVWCSWSFDRGWGSPAPEAIRTYATQTNADGRYIIPALRRFPQGLTTRLARFSLIIYKKEYVGFRYDRIFNQRASRIAFSQRHNVVRLSRWSPELSHARHLFFVGGGPELQRASQWEVAAAVAELDGKALKPAGATAFKPVPQLPSPAKSRFDAKVLLSSDEVRAITGYQGAFTAERLAGSSSDTYDTFHFRAVDQPERYDVALRVWRLSAEKLAGQYEEILKALPGSKQTDEIADRSFTVLQGEILGLGFMERSASVVILITCGRGQCTKDSHLLELAKQVGKNLSRLPPPAGEGPALEGESKSPPPGEESPFSLPEDGDLLPPSSEGPLP